MSAVIVKAGTRVRFEGVGVEVLADLNEPEFGSQPYVTINTADLPPAHTYDERTGMRGDTEPFMAEQDGAGAVVKAHDGTIVMRAFPYDRRSTETLKSAKKYADNLNSDWRRYEAGTPIIAVHLNDCTIFDDEGDGIHRSDTPKTDRLKRAEALLTEAHKRIGSDALADEIQTFLEER